MSLQTLPNELLLDIAGHLSTPKDLSALTQTSKHFNLLFTPRLSTLSLQPHGYSKQVSHCLSAGQSPTYHYGNESRTPLHEALAHGYEVFSDGEKQWWIASRRAHNNLAFEDTVAVLIAAGVNLEARDGSGHTPLHTATVRGLKRLVRVLLALVVQVDAVDVNGFTPLWYARTYGYEEIVGLLVEAGAKEVTFSHSIWVRWLPPRLDTGLVFSGEEEEGEGEEEEEEEEEEEAEERRLGWSRVDRRRLWGRRW
ncbi:ankyrin repeat-containing domain protein [Tuber borchii]|uniref:Ankyrin repeat-containing domain protein n=1 Tax=Tuber borchii TaxID=42251 RepID=A0A2T6ZTW9_TUBBO|nr:ankyrin repeat-containing domain protein [Tuber borchii]